MASFIFAYHGGKPPKSAAQLVVYAARAPAWNPVAEGVPAFAEGPPRG